MRLEDRKVKLFYKGELLHHITSVVVNFSPVFGHTLTLYGDMINELSVQAFLEAEDDDFRFYVNNLEIEDVMEYSIGKDVDTASFFIEVDINE